MKPVVIATDGSEAGDRAIEAGCELAKSLGLELVLVNVEQGFLGRDASRPDPEKDMYNFLYAPSSQILEQGRDLAKRAGVSAVRSHSGLGDATGFILEIVSQESPEFLVVGRRGKGRLSGLLLGSVSQKLVSLAQCKVVVVP